MFQRHVWTILDYVSLGKTCMFCYLHAYFASDKFGRWGSSHLKCTTADNELTPQCWWITGHNEELSLYQHMWCNTDMAVFYMGRPRGVPPASGHCYGFTLMLFTHGFLWGPAIGTMFETTSSRPKQTNVFVWASEFEQEKGGAGYQANMWIMKKYVTIIPWLNSTFSVPIVMLACLEHRLHI